jgi:hypothetical protein
MQDQNAIYLEINVEPENGSVYVHSKHVPGLHLMGKNFQSMKPTIEMAIKRLFNDNEQMQVNVIWLTDRGADAICNVVERIAVYRMDSSGTAA